MAKEEADNFLEKVGKTWEVGALLKSLEANRDRLMDLCSLIQG